LEKASIDRLRALAKSVCAFFQMDMLLDISGVARRLWRLQAWQACVPMQDFWDAIFE
jgi:hypothetical protein